MFCQKQKHLGVLAKPSEWHISGFKTLDTLGEKQIIK